MKIRVVKDDFFATKKWFIETTDGFKWNTVGFKTKKAAEKVAADAVESFGLEVEEPYKWN